MRYRSGPVFIRGTAKDGKMTFFVPPILPPHAFVVTYKASSTEEKVYFSNNVLSLFEEFDVPAYPVGIKDDQFLFYVNYEDHEIETMDVMNIIREEALCEVIYDPKQSLRWKNHLTFIHHPICLQ